MTTEQALQRHAEAEQRKRQQANKLRLLLAQAQSKVDRGAPLSPTEENLIAELDRRMNEKRREEIIVDSDGTIHRKKTIDAEPIMDAVKAYSDLISTRVNTQRSEKYVGSIDPLTAVNWMKESGYRIGTRDFAKFAMNRIKHDIDYRRFKVGG